jgi:L-ascorbate metabolism protein UlaG (beta-lactamase superfamily)
MIRRIAMFRSSLSLLLVSLVLASAASAQEQSPPDIVKTAAGDLVITFIGHGSLMFTYGGMTIHVDPYSKLTDYAKLPKADVILITHEHRDHLDTEALGKIRTDKTRIILTEAGAGQVGGGTVMKNGEKKVIDGLTVEAVPAYNIVSKRENGQPYHPKGAGNGYIITFGDKRLYVAGDTENIPEMKGLNKIDIAFLPMNLPYTMTPEMAADAAKMIQPKVLYPYHTGDTDIAKFMALMKDHKEIEVRIRSMK